MVIGDYNYYYDGSAMLHTLAQQNQWRVGVLVDEAHNLLDRARKMYSASLDPFAFAAAREVAPAALRKAFDRLARAWARSAARRSSAMPRIRRFRADRVGRAEPRCGNR